VAVKFDPTTEEKQVNVLLSGAEAEFLEEMYILAYAITLGFIHKRKGETAEAREQAQTGQRAMKVMLANSDVARKMFAIVKAVHCELHHPGQDCEEAHNDDEEWRDQ